jgi:hypothetical protein
MNQPAPSFSPVFVQLLSDPWAAYGSALARFLGAAPECEWATIHNAPGVTGDPAWSETRIDKYWQSVRTHQAGNECSSEFENVTRAARRLYPELVSAAHSHLGCGPCFIQEHFSLRLFLPGEAVTPLHRDVNLPPGTFNIVLFLSPGYGSNTLWVDSGDGTMRPVETPASEEGPWAFLFDARECLHGGYKNTSPNTRVSADIRLLPVSRYLPDSDYRAPSGVPFRPGGAFANEPVSHMESIFQLRKIKPWPGFQAVG